MLIEYKNKTINTLHYEEITEEQREILQKEFFKKPEFSQVIKQFQTITNGGTMVDKITRYYFRDIMAKTIIKGSKWSVEDVFNSKELLGIFIAKTKTNPRVFNQSTLISKIDTAIRLGGHSIAQFPPNFPLKTAKEIIKKYNINNNWYDFSCGWGVRLLGAMISSINYFGTDPNYLLVERLLEMGKDYKNNIGLTSNIEIIAQGSEVFIPEWENKIGLAFSSPPYFNLENYLIGEQSYKEGTTYDIWLQKYLIPTIQNIYKYLIKDGIFAINIKNNKSYHLEDDVKKLAKECNFTLEKIETLTNNQRITPSGKINNKENIFIFKKNNSKTINIIKEIENNEIIKEKENLTKIENSLTEYYDLYLIGVKSKKQLENINLYNSQDSFLGERYFATFKCPILNIFSDYILGEYKEMTYQTIIQLLNYIIYNPDINLSFQAVPRLCEIIYNWNTMEKNNYHLFLQIVKNKEDT